MGLVAFAVTFVVSAGLLALWIDARFPNISPRDMRSALIHLAVAFVFARVGSKLLGDSLISVGLPGARLIATIGIVLPGLVYACLAVIWLLKSVQAALRGSLP